ncbi:MAG: VCBS repeat-containing protein [bacterium]|nr:VCBS repeat-containing protein [bacterium]
MVSIFLGLTAVPGESQTRDFGFGSMSIFKFVDETSHLHVHDMNNDGLDDILFLNNKVSRLEILIRKKSDISRDSLSELKKDFNNQGFVLDPWIKYFTVSDMNSDGLPDIVCIDLQHGIKIYLQKKDHAFRSPVSLYIKNASNIKNIEIGDLNNNGLLDILACMPGKAIVLWNAGKGKFVKRTSLPFSSYGCQWSMIARVNNDSIPDLVFYFGKEKLPLRVRPGKKGNTYGWEYALKLPAISNIKKVSLLKGKQSQFAALLNNRIILRLYGITSNTVQNLFTRDTVITKRLPLKGVGGKTDPSWVIFDYNDDGYNDLFITAPALNQVHCYRGNRKGLAPVPRVYDTIANANSLEATKFGDLVLFSKAENAIAVHGRKKLSSFPRYLKLPGKPIAMSVAGSTIFSVCKDPKKGLRLIAHNKAGGKGKVAGKLSLQNEPSSMKVIPLPGYRHWAILLYIPYDKPVMFRLHKKKLMRLTPEQFRPLATITTPDMITSVGSKYNPQLLVTRKKIARLFSWKKDRFQIVRQLNPELESVQISAGNTYIDYIDKKKKVSYLLYDESGNDLYVFPRGKRSKKHAINIEGGVKNLLAVTPIRLRKKSGILFIGRSELHYLYDGIQNLELKTISEYTSQDEKPYLWNIYQAKLGNSGKNKLVLLDAHNRSIEIAGLHKNTLSRELVFEVYQSPGHSPRDLRNSFEPHDLGSGDFNGDGIQDLAILVHDKLILYIGE